MIQTLHDKILDFQGVDKVCCVVVGQKSDLGGAKSVGLRAAFERQHTETLEPCIVDKSRRMKAGV